MNNLAHTFRNLLQLLQLEPTDERVEVLLAEVAAGVAAAPYAVCLAFVTEAGARAANGAIALLRPYGLTFSLRVRPGGRLLYAHVGDPTPDPYAGAAVLEIPVLESFELAA